jgi:hypothetical protein
VLCAWREQRRTSGNSEATWPEVDGASNGRCKPTGVRPQLAPTLSTRQPIWQSRRRFARTLAFAGRAATAAQLLSCFATLHEEVGGAEAWVTRDKEETLTAIRAQLDEAALAEAWEQGRKLTADEAVALALEAED